MESSAYLRLLIFILAILIPACASSSPAFLMMYSAYKLNKHSSVQFSHSVMSDSLQPHELQHARPPSPSPTPGVHSNSRPLSWMVMPSSHLILCHPLLLLLPIPPSIRVFSNEPYVSIKLERWSTRRKESGTGSGVLKGEAEDPSCRA